MSADFAAVFAKLRSVLATHAKDLAVKTDTAAEYTLDTKSPSPFKQHKGHPLQFGSVRAGKTYVSYHLMPIYMSAALNQAISPSLKKHMQGKTCFNFKDVPESALIADLERLTQAALDGWRKQKWL